MPINLHKILDFIMVIYIIFYYVFDKMTDTVILSQIWFCVLVVAICFSLIRKPQIYFSLESVMILIFIAFACSSYFWSNNQDTVLHTMLQLCFLGLLFLSYYKYFNSLGRVNLILKTIAISSVIMLFALLFINGYTGVTDRILLGERVSMERMADLNSFGRLAAFSSIISLGILINQPQSMKKYVWFSIFIIDMSCVFYSGSRGALIGFLVGVAVLYKNKVNVKNISLIVLTFVVGTYMVINLLPAYFNNVFIDRFLVLKDVINGSGGDGDIRWLMITQGFSWFLDAPIIGHGLNAFAGLFGNNFGWMVYSHSDIIELLVNLGLCGLLLFYLPVVNTLYNLKACNYKDENLTTILIAITCSYLVNSIYTIQYIDKFSYILIAILMASVRLMRLKNRT